MERRSRSHGRRAALGVLLACGSLLAAPFVAGCSTLQVYSVAMPGASFAGYHTYAHGPPEGTPDGFAHTALTPEVWKKVQPNIDASLALKGLSLAPAGAAPDLIVRSGSGARVEVRHQDDAAHAREAWVDASVTAEYTEATIVIDVFDAHTHKLIWHGASGRSLDLPLNAATDASVAQAVKAILAGFPIVSAAPAAPAPAGAAP